MSYFAVSLCVFATQREIESLETRLTLSRKDRKDREVKLGRHSQNTLLLSTLRADASFAEKREQNPED